MPSDETVDTPPERMIQAASELRNRVIPPGALTKVSMLVSDWLFREAALATEAADRIVSEIGCDRWVAEAVSQDNMGYLIAVNAAEAILAEVRPPTG